MLVAQINKALQGKNVFEPRIEDYALCKHMNISDTEIGNMDEEKVQFWKIMMRRELRHQEKINSEV